ncbi:hypothetical protein OTU49_005074 [Cherax quadricarinatus]|uniref:Uncharacterized protein n=1 Tax=Cherax quadricarinatus TaxID=27406 RepID=A0AAW0YL91_CHEQU
MHKVYRQFTKSWRTLKYTRQYRCISTCARHYDKFETRAEFSNGRTMYIETGEYARLADGAAVAKLGDTSVLITAIALFVHCFLWATVVIPISRVNFLQWMVFMIQMLLASMQPLQH